jgi:hypothetical protein
MRMMGVMGKMLMVGGPFDGLRAMLRIDVVK